MKFKLSTQVVITALAGSVTVAPISEAAPMPTVVTPSPAVITPRPTVTTPPTTQLPSSQPQTTVFSCVTYGTQFATVAQRGDRRTGPMIIWQTRAFGSEFTPQQRCEQVSARLTNAVSQNGGSLRNLKLTTGHVNKQTVVCFINTAERCSSTNILFTLKPENASNTGDVLTKLTQFGRLGAGTSVFESGGREEAAAVSLEEAVNQAFESGSTSVVSPEPIQPGTSNPVTSPATVVPNRNSIPEPNNTTGGI